MVNLDETDQLGLLRGVIFNAVQHWNAAHPHPVRSHHERGSVNVTQIFADASGVATYSITVSCTLAGAQPLTFHGQALAAVAEHARLTLERKIAAELQRREYRAGIDRNYDVAV